MIRFAFTDKYLYYLPEGHRFPIEKYELVKQQLVHEGTIEEAQVFDPGLVEEGHILAVHDASYWEALKTLSLDKKAVRKIGLPVTATSVNRARSSVAGTMAAAINALDAGAGANLAGGTHHAYRGHGEGFCALNDIAITARYMLDEHHIDQVLVIDLDVHQGNGTAHIFKDEPKVFTFSMHGAGNYPMHKEQSDLDVELPSGTGDEAYLEVLSHHLEVLFQTVQPSLVFYQSGVDVLASDRLGKLALTREGARERDKLVISHCHSGQIPLVVTMGGGYSQKLTDLIDAHCNTFRTLMTYYS